MNDYERRHVRELFPRLFVLAINTKMNLYAFTNALTKSKLVSLIEKDLYDDYYNKQVEEIYYDITGFIIYEDNSYGVYNDAYWSGEKYFDLHIKTNKSFEYLFLKFPFEKMLDAYNVYHEMDFSSLLEYFEYYSNEKTIIRLLCDNKRCSLNDVAKDTNININTLIKYNSNDEYLYNASFKNVYKLINYFDVHNSLFIN